MRMFARMLVCVAAALLSAVLINLSISWFDEEPSALHLGRLLVLEARRSQAMNARSEMVGHSLDNKRGIIEQLLAGSLRLSEAIDEFHKANGMIVNGNGSLVARYQLPADREGVGRQVLVWVHCTVGHEPPSKTQRRLEALESEYQKLFGHPSPLDPSQTAEPLPNACCAG